MVLPSEREELLAAWRALSGDGVAEGWRTIPVALGGPCRLLAGRHFPGNEEALLVGFSSVRLPPPDQLPQGRGFLVCQPDLGQENAGRVFIALRRQSAGNLELFAMMADDIVSTLGTMRGANDERFFSAFLARIRAWQDFMRRGADGLLSPEAEVGLFGELEILVDLLSTGLPPSVAVEAWQGPLDGIWDFVLGTGAIEVKSTVAPNGFLATIGSLEQLDGSLTGSLFLAAVRLALNPNGRTLPEKAGELRDVLRGNSAAFGLFESRLLHAGFLDATAERYTRRFSRAGARTLLISHDFPCLTRATVGIEIKSARYELDIDLVGAGDVGLNAALQQLGVI